MKNLSLSHTVALLIALSFLSAGSVLAAYTLGPSMEGITEYRLDNGLRVLLFPEHSQQTVTTSITYFAGSRHEGLGEKGMAHLLEHMLFKGTKQFEHVLSLIEERGGWANGNTWLDRTMYFEQLPTANAENLEYEIRLEADRMRSAKIDAAELESERTVVLNEFEVGQSFPTEVFQERLYAAAYLWHNYRNSVVGPRSDISHISTEQLKAFYDRYYQPDNAILTVIGNFEPEAALPLIDKYFGAIPRPERALVDTYTVEPAQDGPRYVELHRVGDVAWAGLAYHIPAAVHPDYVALDVLADLLTREPYGLLYQELVKKGLASSVEGACMSAREPNLMMISAQAAKPLNADELLKRMTSLVERLTTGQIDSANVERAKTHLLSDLESLQRQGERMGMELGEWAASGDWRLFFAYRDAVEQVKAEDLQRVAAYYLVENNRTAGIFRPLKQAGRVEIPPSPKVDEIVAKLVQKQGMSQGESIEASPEAIERLIQRTALANGLKLELLPKATRGHVIHAVMSFHASAEMMPPGSREAVSLMGELMLRGTKKHTYEQITDLIAQYKAKIFIWVNPVTGIEVHLEADQHDLPQVLELTAECLRSPTFPEPEFEIVRKARIAVLEGELSEPMSRASIRLQQLIDPFPPTDIRYVPSIAERIEWLKKTNVKELRQFYKSNVGGDVAEATFIGDFAADQIRSAMERLFGDWRAEKPYQRVKQTYREAPGVQEAIATPDRELAMDQAGMILNIGKDDPDYPALRLGVYILGGAAQSRLFARLRDKEGLTYGAYAYAAVDDLDRYGSLIMDSLCSPATADQIMTAFSEELQKLMTEPVPQDEFEKDKEAMILGDKTDLASERWLVRTINELTFANRTLDFYRDLDNKLAQLTPAEVQKVMTKYIDLKRLSRVKAGDFKP